MPTPTDSPWKDLKPLDETFAACSAALQRAAEKLSAEYIAVANKLTEEQFIEALRQAIACGDFLRHVRADNGGQAVTYEPYREVERLKARIRELEIELERAEDAALDTDRL